MVGSVVGCGLWVGIVVGQWWLWIGVVVGCGLWIGVVVGYGLWIGVVGSLVVDRRLNGFAPVGFKSWLGCDFFYRHGFVFVFVFVTVFVVCGLC